MTRAERRRAEREAAKRRGAVLIAGDGIIARSLGTQYEGVAHAELPPRVFGHHRWIANAAYVLSLADVKGATDADRMKYLDQENLFMLAIGCYDCERPLGDITVDSFCAGDPSDG